MVQEMQSKKLRNAPDPVPVWDRPEQFLRQIITCEMLIMLEISQPYDLFSRQVMCYSVLQVSGQVLPDILFKRRILIKDSAYSLKELCSWVIRSGNCEW